MGDTHRNGIRILLVYTENGAAAMEISGYFRTGDPNSVDGYKIFRMGPK